MRRGKPRSSRALMSCGFTATYIVSAAAFVPLLYAVEPVSLAVRFPRQTAVELGFSAMSRGSAPTLIPLIGGRPPGTAAAAAAAAAGESRPPPTPSRYSFIKAETDTVPNRPQRRTGQPAEQQTVCARV